jgi:hypothetical protein
MVQRTSTIVKPSEPFAIDADFLIKYFGIPIDISSHSQTGYSAAYMHFHSDHNSNPHMMRIGDWGNGIEGNYGNSIELQLLCLIAYLKITNDF